MRGPKILGLAKQPKVEQPQLNLAVEYIHSVENRTVPAFIIYKVYIT